MQPGCQVAPKTIKGNKGQQTGYHWVLPVSLCSHKGQKVWIYQHRDDSISQEVVKMDSSLLWCPWAVNKLNAW